MIAFLDIETTGLNPREHEILEVAIIRWPEDDYVEFTLPIDQRKASKEALEVNRYRERFDELRRRQITDDAAFANFRWGLHERIVVGNNPQFDLRFIEQWFVKHGSVYSATPWNYHPIDLKALVGGRHPELGEPPWSTGQIAKAVGVPLPDEQHTALADARWNRDVYKAVFA